MKVLDSKQYEYLGWLGRYIFRSRAQNTEWRQELLMVPEGKYIHRTQQGHVYIVFLCEMARYGGQPKISYSMATQRRIASGALVDIGLVEQMLSKSVASDIEAPDVIKAIEVLIDKTVGSGPVEEEGMVKPVQPSRAGTVGRELATL